MTRLMAEGEDAPRFHVYINGLNNEPVKSIASCNTIEVKAHTQRRDRAYTIYMDRKPMTLREFWEWAKTQK